MSKEQSENSANKTTTFETTTISPVSIQQMVYTIRGQQVILDSDLAMLYGYEVKALNQQVKRNISRFPEDFMFQLTMDEVDFVKSHFVTSPNSSFFSGQSGGRRKPPFAFTEQGIYMLSTVLKGDLAEKQSIYIMRAFREMRKFISCNSLLFEKISKVELRQLEFEKSTDDKLKHILDYLESSDEIPQKVFFEGQIYDAFSLITGIIQKAQKNIILIDGYVDTSTLNILSKKQDGITVDVYTSRKGNSLTSTDITTFNSQYPELDIKYTSRFHDRFIILDHTIGYHIGASIKDAGKKCFAISTIEDAQSVKAIIAQL